MGSKVKLIDLMRYDGGKCRNGGKEKKRTMGMEGRLGSSCMNRGNG